MLWYLSPFNFIAKGRVVKSKLCLHRRGTIHFGAVLRILGMLRQLWFTKNVTFLWQFILWGGTQQQHPRREIIPCEPQDVFDTREYTHPKKNHALLTFVDHCAPQHATEKTFPKGCGTSHSTHTKNQGTFFKFGLMCRISQGATHCHSGS